jgi:hypothetical protein
MEWFSARTAHPGQSEVVYARLWIQNRAVSGARLVATVKAGKRVLLTARGTTTNARGQATARFTVPRLPHSTSLQIIVTLYLKAQAFVGTNDLWIQV